MAYLNLISYALLLTAGAIFAGSIVALMYDGLENMIESAKLRREERKVYKSIIKSLNNYQIIVLEKNDDCVAISTQDFEE